MWCVPLRPDLRLFAPVFAARLALVLAAVAALVARRFVQDLALAGHTLALWGRLHRAGRRCVRLCGQIAMGRVEPGRVRVRARAGHTPAAPVAWPPPLPCGQGWLTRLLGYEAAGYGCQLQALLDTPDAVALLAEAPGLVRLVNPIRRMLGVGGQAPRPRRVPAVAGVQPDPPRRPAPVMRCWTQGQAQIGPDYPSPSAIPANSS